MQFPSTFYTPDALGYMSHSLNRSHIRLAYFQPMASCLADGFFPSRLICKIKNFFDVFSHFFHIFVGAGRAENMQENTNACGHSGNAPAGIIKIGFYRFALRARSRIVNYPHLKKQASEEASLKTQASSPQALSFPAYPGDILCHVCKRDPVARQATPVFHR